MVRPATSVYDDNAELSGLAELMRRTRHNYLVASTGTTLFSLLFFVGYFLVMWHPATPPSVMPLTVVDVWIPLQRWALWPYLALWIYLGAGPGLQPNRAEMLRYTAWMLGLCVTGLTLFYVWPTQVPPVQPDSSFGFTVLHQVDRAGNACPSMHVAAAIFTAIRVGTVLRLTQSPTWLRLSNAAVCAAITYSTLATKQHVFIDVLAGCAMGAGFAFASLLRRAPITAIKDGASVTAPPSR